jgi:predicted transposase/invertase (TIGR01784 family)
MEVLLRYLFNSPGELNTEELHEQVTSILEEGGDIMQTIAQQLREEGIKIGEEKGKKEGMEENAKETAKKMLEKGFDLDMIVEITGLKPSEIERLREITN